MKNLLRTLLCAPLLLATASPTPLAKETAQLYTAYHGQTSEAGSNILDNADDLTDRLLHKYHLAKPLHNPFTYAHLTEIYNESMGQSQPLHSTLEKVAREQYAYLDNAFF
ncbi:MAG: hypothetical protein PVJ92_00795, partial [Candidatus Dependentiae bacterium]